MRACPSAEVAAIATKPHARRRGVANKKNHLTMAHGTSWHMALSGISYYRYERRDEVNIREVGPALSIPPPQCPVSRVAYLQDIAYYRTGTFGSSQQRT
jgi:hypothetical protein